MKEITWKTGTGAEAKVTVSLVLTKVTDADGIKIETPCCEIEITASVQGMTIGTGRPRKITHPQAVAAIGKLAMSPENLQRVEAAIAEIENGPEWTAKLEAEVKAAKSVDEVEAHRAKMRKVMGY